VSAVVWVLAAVACGAGAVVRYLIAHRAPLLPFPWTTVVANALGSAVLGAVAAALDAGAPASAGIIVGAGFAGGLSTFSTLAVDAVILLNERRPREFWVYLGATAGVGLGSAFAGFLAWSWIVA